MQGIREAIAPEEHEGEGHEQKDEDGAGYADGRFEDRGQGPILPREGTSGEQFYNSVGAMEQPGDEVVPARPVPESVENKSGDDGTAHTGHGWPVATKREEDVVPHPRGQ